MAAGKRHRNKKNKNKVSIVFDENERREFLTGFRKRNLEKRKKQEEELEKRLKEEKKRIKQEAKESYKKLVKTRTPIPELEELFNNEFETEEASVKIVELSTNDNINRNHWIGPNRPNPEKEESEMEESEEEKEEELPGMGFTETVENNDFELDTGGGDIGCMSKKEINKMIKNEATEKIQKSKIFQKKNKVERMKNKKKSLLKAKERKRFNKKNIKTKSKLHKRNHGKRK